MTEAEKQNIKFKLEIGHTNKYKSIMKSKEIRRKTKMTVYRIAIQPMVTYRIKTMILTKGEEEKVRKFE